MGKRKFKCTGCRIARDRDLGAAFNAAKAYLAERLEDKELREKLMKELEE